MSNFERFGRASLFVVDAFTNKPFRGNSAAVCLLPFHEIISKETKQNIAVEMNLSETAFITTKFTDDTFEKGTNFDLEWFTPTCEVKLCGHATLAVAAVLFLNFDNKSEVLEFETLSGILKAKRLNDDKIQIDLPAYGTSPVKSEFDKLVKAVVGSLPVEDVVLSKSKNLVIRLSDKITRQDLESIQTKDDELLSASSDVIGVIVTLKAEDKDDCKDDVGDQYDFLSRYFAPWLGVSEDPVCGSAHSVLAPYWSKILQKTSFYAHQCSARGGDLNLKLADDRVLMSGNAVIIIKGRVSF